MAAMAPMPLHVSSAARRPRGVVVNSGEKLPKSATQKVSRVGKFMLAFSSASLNSPERLFSKTVFLLRHLQAFIPVVDFALPLPLCFLGGRAAFHRLCAEIMEHARLALLTKAIPFSSNVHRRRIMQ